MSKPLHIGIDCRMFSSQFTGIGRYVYELVENLQKTDQVNQYTLFFNTPEFEIFNPTNPNFKKILVNAKHYSLAEQLKFWRILRKAKLDLMHFTHFNAPILYLRPSVVTIHDLTVHFFPGKKMTSPLHRLAYHLTIKSTVAKAKKIIAVSRSTAKDLQEVLHTKSDKITVIYEGVNHQFKPIEDAHALLPTLKKFGINKQFLLYTGVWRDHKNLPGLIQAFKLLLEQGQDLQLVITGKKDNIYAEQIFQLAGDLTQQNGQHNQNRIIFTDLVSEQELIYLLNAAHLYVFPSFYEGFGLPPLEAMQCRTPVAASNTSCIPEICGNNAIYFDPQKPEEMAASITKLLTDEQLYHQLQASGQDHVKKFSWEKMTAQTLELYQAALAPKSK